MSTKPVCEGAVTEGSKATIVSLTKLSDLPPLDYKVCVLSRFLSGTLEERASTRQTCSIAPTSATPSSKKAPHNAWSATRSELSDGFLGRLEPITTLSQLLPTSRHYRRFRKECPTASSPILREDGQFLDERLANIFRGWDK